MYSIFYLHSFLEQKERDTQLRSYIAHFSVHQIFCPIIISTKYIQIFLPEAMMTLVNRQSHQNSQVFIKAHHFFVSLTLFFQYVSFKIMIHDVQLFRFLRFQNNILDSTHHCICMHLKIQLQSVQFNLDLAEQTIKD